MTAATPMTVHVKDTHATKKTPTFPGRNCLSTKCEVNYDKAPNCTNCPHKAIREVPEVKNYSQAKRSALALLGPRARVWHGEPNTPPVSIGIEQNPGRLVLGFGDTFQDALEKAVVAYSE